MAKKQVHKEHKPAKPRAIRIYDALLRDGTQAEEINFSVEDKLLIAEKLDELGTRIGSCDGVMKIAHAREKGSASPGGKGNLSNQGHTTGQ